MRCIRTGAALAAFACAAAALLGGCSGRPDGPAAPACSAAGPKQVQQAEQQPFRLISPPDYRSYGSGNRFGYYGIFNNEDGSRNILYTDYQTASQVYLCGQPNCSHDGPACTSWIAPGPESVIAAASDERLFLITSSRGGSSYIERCELDGTDRRRVCEFAAGTTLENAVAANDQALIVSVEEYGPTGDEVGFDARLLRIGLADGRTEPLFSLAQLLRDDSPERASMHFLGCAARDVFWRFLSSRRMRPSRTTLRKPSRTRATR